jgi:hypothetical protein
MRAGYSLHPRKGPRLQEAMRSNCGQDGIDLVTASHNDDVAAALLPLVMMMLLLRIANRAPANLGAFSTSGRCFTACIPFAPSVAGALICTFMLRSLQLA